MITDFTAQEQALLDNVQNWEGIYSEKPTVFRVKEGHFGNEFLINLLLRDRIASKFPFSDARRAVFQEQNAVMNLLESNGIDDRAEWDKALAPFRGKFQSVMDGPNDYGVCDTVDQVVEKWPELLTDPRRFIICFTQIDRADQPEHGGWRWHKWGEYIGTKEPMSEYLADEPEIDSVLCFSIIELKPAE